ncbi:MAG: sugar ABC transporter substrate-binding protein [Lachnospiraceae bacterium]|nr:sugar ABC transporter substrate-binding protein [Lachnospiraceae bacterium]
MRKRLMECMLLLAACFFVVFFANRYTGYDLRIKKPEYREYTAFFTVPGISPEDDNEIMEKIAELTGAKCREIWLSGQTADAAIASCIAGGEYPDFISGSAALYEAGALLPIDEYWDAYPNIRGYLEEDVWDQFRQEDGHIYWIPQFNVVHREGAEALHEGEAFWIQTRVLKWAGYPQITTVQEYFSLIEAYMKENPCMADGESNIPFMLLCDDWRYFCLENPPQFLAGFPNDGCCMVDPDTLTVMDYNVTETAKAYFALLNQEFHAGMIAPESFTQSYEEYLEMLASGRVLGMVEQWWQFAYDVGDALSRKAEEGCGYVPLPIVMEKGIKNQWHTKRGNDIDTAEGISITVSCKDVKGAMCFINDLLDERVMKLRFWGVEDVDYHKDESGIYYKTPEQRARARDGAYLRRHFCYYSYFPRLEGMAADGINAFSAEFQPEEFYAALPEDVRTCLAAYGCRNYVDMLGSNEQPGVWYPMYSHAKRLTQNVPAGRVYKAMEEVKQTYLPRVVLAEDFESMWEQYMEAYSACHPEVFFEEMQRELDRRVEDMD